MCKTGLLRRKSIVEMGTAALRLTTIPQHKINKRRRSCRKKCVHHVSEHLSTMSPDFTLVPATHQPGGKSRSRSETARWVAGTGRGHDVERGSPMAQGQVAQP